MYYLIIAGVFAAGYAGFRYYQYRKAVKAANEKFSKADVIDVVNFAFGSALFNAIMGGLSFSFVVGGLEDMTLRALYLAVGGIFLGNVFDAYHLKRVIFTKTALYLQNKTIRYNAIESIHTRKYSKKFLLTTHQKEQFVVPQIVVNKIQEISGKKKLNK